MNESWTRAALISSEEWPVARMFACMEVDTGYAYLRVGFGLRPGIGYWLIALGCLPGHFPSMWFQPPFPC
jgi:hypothetical protein